MRSTELKSFKNWQKHGQPGSEGSHTDEYVSHHLATDWSEIND